MKHALSIFIVLLIATVARAGELNLSGFVKQAPGEMFNDGVGFQADYTQTVFGNWFATGGLSYATWNMRDYGWEHQKHCTRLSYQREGSLSDARMFLGVGYSAALPWGFLGRLSGDIGYDIIDSDVSDTLTFSSRRRGKSYPGHSLSCHRDFDADDTVTGRLNLRLVRPLAKKVGLSLDVGYTHDFNDQELTVDGQDTGVGVDLSGWSAGLGLIIRM